MEPPLIEDQAVCFGTLIELRVETPVETPLLKDLIDLGAEDNTTATGLHDIHGIHDIHNLCKVDLNLGGASGQVEQGAVKQVVEDQAPVEDSLLKDMIDLGMEATWLLSNLNSGGAGEQAMEAVVVAPLLKDRAAVEAPCPRT